jgi:filamentous hemagglutinin
MKPKRFYFKGTPLFSTTLRYGAPVFIGFTVLFTGLSSEAAIYGAPAASGSSPTPAAPSNSSSGTSPAAATVARENARATLARTSQAVGAARAMQDAARAAAASGPNHLSTPSLTLPSVPNGLGTGGLQVAPGVTAGSSKWTGADLPTETADKKNVTIKQTAQQALLNWQSFNVGKDTTVTFDQTAGGAEVGKWIAFNRVTDPTGNPTQILGKIKADGQVYIINGNGIIFGGSSQINTRGLTVSSLPINDNLVARGLLNNPDNQFLFSGLAMPAGVNGTPAFTPEAALTANGQYGDVIVQAGATLTSPSNSAKVGGRITLVGANVVNDGTILTPDGQTILAAGLQVGFTAHASTDPSLRGLDPIVGQVGSYAGSIKNHGIIDAARGSIVLTGREIQQNGNLESSTSVALNGRIDLLAQYNATSNTNSEATRFPFLLRDTGLITLGEDSLIRILPEWDSKETSIGSELALRSELNAVGKVIHLDDRSTILAPNAKVNLSAGIWYYPSGALVPVFLQSEGQVYLGEDAQIDVSGSTGVEVPVEQNIVTVQLRGAELAGSPLQRMGVLRNATVSVDIRDAGVYQQNMWVGTPLADISGFANLIQKGVGQLTVAGGSVTINAGESVVMQSGSKIDVSGGTIEYTGGTVKTTQLISNGKLVDISKALPNEVYDGIYGASSVKTDPKWGVSESHSNALTPQGSRFEEGYVAGAAGGSLAITAASMALDGQMAGRVYQSTSQRQTSPGASSLKLSFYQQDKTLQALPLSSPYAPTIEFRSNVSQSAAEAFALDGSGNPSPLSLDRKSSVFLAPELLTDSGFGKLTVDNKEGEIRIPENVKLIGQVGGALTLFGTNIYVDGQIKIAGGTLSLSTYSIPLSQVNLFAQVPPAVPPVAQAGRGLFTLGSSGVLDVSGMAIDDRFAPSSGMISPITLKGGAVNIQGYSANLLSGGLINVSGGALVSASGGVTYGDAGAISISTGREIGFSATLGGKLQLGAELMGYSGAKAGSLSLTASAFQVGQGVASPDVTVLQPEFFSQGGFGSISLAGIGVATPQAGVFVPGVHITAGTQVRPVVSGYFANTTGANGLVLEKITREEGLRSPMSLSFSAQGAEFAGVPLVIGNVRMDAGASVQVDGTLTTDSILSTAGKGSISFNGQTVELFGSVIAPGGSITVAGRSQFPSDTNTPAANALVTTHLGSTSVLSTAGKTILVENPFGLRRGQVISGGTITVSGNIVAERGTLLDVSGARGVLDLPRTYLAPGITPDGFNTVPVTLESNGGKISLLGSDLLFTEATLLGKAGGQSASGGTLAVGSSRFVPFGTAYNTAEANLIVSQNGLTLTSAPALLGVGKTVRKADGTLAAQMGHFAVSSAASGGFDSLALNGNVRFDGPVSITVPGSLRIANGGVIYSNDEVALTAHHVALGLDFRPPTQLVTEPLFTQGVNGILDISNYAFSPTHGNGKLTVTADLIDVGDLSLQGIGKANLVATRGDIRGNGTLDIAGDLTLEAGQIYPTTQRAFNIFAYDYLVAGTKTAGSVTIKGGSPRSLPLSGGGTLSVYASHISQGGTLRAPLGTINLGWNGTGTAPFDPIAGAPTTANPFQRPVTSLLNVESGSTTSVSVIDPITGKAALIPYGISLDGKTWIDPAGNDITLTGAPAKAINLSAAQVTTAANSTLDIRGGGDLYAYRWISGNGGKTDILASSTSYAIIPNYNFDYAPYAPFNQDSTATKLGGQAGYANSSLKVGDSITLAEGAGLSAGTYTLLPARYALLPGAFLITPQTGAPSGTVARPGGAFLVSGYRSNEMNADRAGITQVSSFEIAPFKVVRARAEYVDLLANNVLKQAALSRELGVPRLPEDSGYLSFSATANLALAGQVSSISLGKGRGSLIDINSPGNILINSTGTGGMAGDLVLSSSLLNSFGAESLLIGGLRSFANNRVSVAVNADNLTVANGSSLSGSDLVLVAEKQLTLGEDVSLTGTGNNLTLDDLYLGTDSISGSGNGALVRVSGTATGKVYRAGVTSSDAPALSVFANAALSGGSIVLDSTAATNFDSRVKFDGESISLSSGQISLQLTDPGTLNPTTGLVLSSAALAELQSAAKSLALLSYSSIDVYGTGTVGSRAFEQLSLQASAIRGFNTGGGTATFSASNLLLENFAGRTAPAALGGPLQGSIHFDANQITLGSNALRVDGFSNTLFAARNGILTTGTGGFSASGNLNIQAPIITGASAANYQINADAAFQYSRPSTSPTSSLAGGFGAQLTLNGNSLAIDSNITLASGVLTLAARSGNVVVGGTAASRLDVGGTATSFVDVTRYTSGGTVNLTSSNGSVQILDHGVLSLSAQPGGGNAGMLNIATPRGSFELTGTITASAGSTGLKGGFSLDAGSLLGGSLASLDETLNKGQFSQSRRYRIRTGDVTVAGNVLAHDYQVTADQGNLTVTGKIDASGETGGNIHLQSSGSLVLANGANLTVAGLKFDNAGKGGTITLEAGSHRNGVIDRSALLDLRSGSTLNLSVAENLTTSASLGKFTGKLHLRAPRTAANNDLQMAAIGSSITGASSILVEGYKLYSLTGEGVITTAIQNSIRDESAAYLGAAGTTTANYSAIVGRLTAAQPDLSLILAPGAEIINPTGNLTLGTTTSTATSDWNLQDYRYGPKGAAGVLTMRAAGNLIFYNALSDGFAAVTPSATNGQSSLWLAPLMAQNSLLPANTQSWSYRFTSGADFSAADFKAVQSLTQLAADRGSLLLGKNYGNAATYGSGSSFLTSTAIANRYQVIRTGSGDITITAARDALLLNQFSTIYTAGTQVLDPTTLFTTGDFVTPYLVSSTGRQPTPGSVIGSAQQDYFVQYSMAGGEVSIDAGNNIAHMTRTVSTGLGGTLIADSSRQLPTNWLHRRGFVDSVTGLFGVGGADDGGASITDPSASTTWWVDHSNFFEGVGTLGGGNITLTAGNDVQNIDALAPTNARMASGKPDASKLVELGGGDITIRAGRNIDGGVYYVERGIGTLEAGGSITTNATRSPSRGLLASLTSPLVFDANTWLPTTLFLGKGGFNLQAAGDLLLGPVANSFLMPQGYNNKFWYKTYFSTYAADSFVNAISLGGDVTHRTSVSLPGELVSRPALSAWLIAHQTLATAQGSASFQPWLRLVEATTAPFNSLTSLMAPNLQSTALTGDIKLQGDLTLSPSPQGQIELIAKGSIIGLQPSGFNTNLGVQRWITSTVNLSDADPLSIPSITSPYAYQQVVGRAASLLRTTNAGIGQGFLTFLDDKFKETGSSNGSLQKEQSLHTPRTLHVGDATPLRVYALDGNIEGFSLFSPKFARVLAGQDISDIAFYLQNVSSTNTSVVSAGRDLTLYNANSASRNVANASVASNAAVQLTPLAGDIQISGAGELQVLAGRNIDLGLGGGNADGTGVGITSIGNSRNPYLDFSGANLTVAAGIGPATSLLGSAIQFAAFIKDFVLTPAGTAYLAKIDPKIKFAEQSPEEQARLALEIFYLILRDAGRDHNNPDSPDFRTYAKGMAAIKSLFGEGPWSGELLTQGRDIRTKNGGDIRLLTPGGGVTLANTTLGNPTTPPGIVTEAGGKISIFADQSINIGIGRIFTLRGGDAMIWSSKGDIAAGSSSRTVAAAPPTRVLVDTQSASVETDLAGLATGGGIGALATVEGVKPADIDLISVTGNIDAGDAGIRVSGNINISAVSVSNAGNISAGGSSSGVPSAGVSAPSVASVSSAANTAAASAASETTANQKPVENTPTVEESLSIIRVEVIGYGGGDEEEEEEDKDKNKETL